MSDAFEPRDRPQDMPATWQPALTPGPETPYFGADVQWYERVAEDLHTVRVCIFGDGSEATPWQVFVWVLPLHWQDRDEDGSEIAKGVDTRFPTLPELWDAMDLVLEGALFGGPMYMAGVTRPDSLPLQVAGTLVSYRQISAQEGSPAKQRAELLAGKGGIVGGIN